MAFIKNKERKSLIKKINQSYTFKKFLILSEIIALIGFIALAFISEIMDAEGFSGWKWVNIYNELTRLGIGMLVYACLIAFFGIISVILIFTIKSPRNVIRTNKKLQSSALSGKKIKNQTAGEVMKSRTTMKHKK